MPMTVKDYVSGSCAGGEIISLSAHSDAADAMGHFCKTVLGMPGGPKAGFFRSRTQPKFNQTASHYVFIAGPERDSDKGSSRSWGNYGTEFAAYIESNGLGLVATLPKVKNRKYHPTTTCQIWIWQPNQEALEAWWSPKVSKEIAALEESERTKFPEYARLKEAGVPMITVESHGALPTILGPNALYGMDGYIGSKVVFRSSEGQVLYHNSTNGTSNYTHLTSASAPRFGVPYRIVRADPDRWYLVEEAPPPEAPPAPEVKPVRRAKKVRNA